MKPAPSGDALVTHRGGCHCGAVYFEVDAPGDAELVNCNCSICSATGFLHLIVPKQQFRLIRGAAALAEYRFNSRQARHLFCRHCGIKSFYIPRSHPDGVSVNAHCLAGATLSPRAVRDFDGRRWEQSIDSLRKP